MGLQWPLLDLIYLELELRTFNIGKHEFKKNKIEYNRIRATRFPPPGTRFLNRVVSQLTISRYNFFLHTLFITSLSS